MTEDAAERVRRARSASSSADLKAIYAEWAASYDADVFDVLGFTGSARIADLLAEHVPDRTLPVLDIGCGTGAVGARLAEHGFVTIDGVDLSPEMLGVARGRGCYRSLQVADLTSGEALPGVDYAASVSAGTFTCGHVGVEHLDPILAAHASRATIAWVVAEPAWASFERALAGRVSDVLVQSLEAVRADAPAESVMLVARLA